MEPPLRISRKRPRLFISFRDRSRCAGNAGGLPMTHKYENWANEDSNSSRSADAIHELRCVPAKSAFRRIVERLILRKLGFVAPSLR